MLCQGSIAISFLYASITKNTKKNFLGQNEFQPFLDWVGKPYRDADKMKINTFLFEHLKSQDFLDADFSDTYMVEYHQEEYPIVTLYTNSSNWGQSERSGGFIWNILLNKNCFNHQIFGLG